MPSFNFFCKFGCFNNICRRVDMDEPIEIITEDEI